MENFSAPSKAMSWRTVYSPALFQMINQVRNSRAKVAMITVVNDYMGGIMCDWLVFVHCVRMPIVVLVVSENPDFIQRVDTWS